MQQNKMKGTNKLRLQGEQYKWKERQGKMRVMGHSFWVVVMNQMSMENSLRNRAQTEKKR